MEGALMLVWGLVFTALVVGAWRTTETSRGGAVSQPGKVGKLVEAVRKAVTCASLLGLGFILLWVLLDLLTEETSPTSLFEDVPLPGSQMEWLGHPPLNEL